MTQAVNDMLRYNLQIYASRKLAILLAILFRTLFHILFAVLFAIVFTIIFAILFPITVRALFINIGPVMVHQGAHRSHGMLFSEPLWPFERSQ